MAAFICTMNFGHQEGAGQVGHRDARGGGATWRIMSSFRGRMISLVVVVLDGVHDHPLGLRTVGGKPHMAVIGVPDAVGIEGMKLPVRA